MSPRDTLKPAGFFMPVVKEGCRLEFNKPALSFEKQIDLLISRGLEVVDYQSAVHMISHTNYYRLAAYYIPHYQLGSNKFKAGIDFSKIYSDYTFDKELRHLVVSAIECIEISVRTRWAYEISNAYGAHGYLVWNKRIYCNEHRLNSNISELRKQVERSNEPFVKHYLTNYDEELPPAWVVCEVMSFGLLSKFYWSLSSIRVRTAISATYSLDEGLFEGLLQHLANWSSE